MKPTTTGDNCRLQIQNFEKKVKLELVKKTKKETDANASFIMFSDEYPSLKYVT